MTLGFWVELNDYHTLVCIANISSCLLKSPKKKIYIFFTKNIKNQQQINFADC